MRVSAGCTCNAGSAGEYFLRSSRKVTDSAPTNRFSLWLDVVKCNYEGLLILQITLQRYKEYLR
jgi:hypothetical protein